MKFTKPFLLILLLQSSVSFSATPYSYASATNPMAEMFLIMMDMFGMVDYYKGYGNSSPYTSTMPVGYGSMAGMAPGLSQMSPLSALNPMSGLPMANGVMPTFPSASNTLNPNYLNQQALLVKSPLEGVWLGSNGDILVFMGSKFFYSTHSAKKLTGTARIVENKIIADIDDSDQIIKYFYELKGGYLAVRVKKEILYFKKQI